LASAQPSAPPRWIAIVAIAALLIALCALAVALMYHPAPPEIADLRTLRTQVQQLQIQLQSLNETVKILNNKVQTLEAKKENISRTEIETLQAEIKRLQAEIEDLKINQTRAERLLVQISQLKKELEKIENTSWQAVDNYIKSISKGWSAEEMAQNLTSRFWVETRIVEHNGVKYLFLRFKCNCGPTTNPWWWVTWRGLLPSNEAPVKP
jgi:uncharacterized protein YlxW (UPF0749 family)